jgi:hypothetical protein
MPIYGMMTQRIPDFQKCYIQCQDIDTTVIGLLESESEATISNTFSQAFGTNTVQDLIRKGIGAFQSEPVSDAYQQSTGNDTNFALISELNTQQIFDGTETPELELPLFFVAMENPQNEVELAIAALKEMAMPKLTFTGVGSRPPPKVAVNMKRQILLTEGKIQNLVVNDFGAWSEQGTAWAKANVTIKAMQLPPNPNNPENIPPRGR